MIASEKWCPLSGIMLQPFQNAGTPMKCPIDGSDLTMTERQGIEIDYCPKCRGVWLDRGELDKIIERATPAQSAPPAFAQQQPAPYPPRPERFDERRYDDDRYKDRDHRHRKRKGFLGELFDFD
jgi:Zn-finger nucleic acid-binding protein